MIAYLFIARVYCSFKTAMFCIPRQDGGRYSRVIYPEEVETTIND